jgi:hypothetical protein
MEEHKKIDSKPSYSPEASTIEQGEYKKTVDSIYERINSYNNLSIVEREALKNQMSSIKTDLRSPDTLQRFDDTKDLNKAFRRAYRLEREELINAYLDKPAAEIEVELREIEDSLNEDGELSEEVKKALT